ncbi:MAG: PIN domain-containing protein [Fimbriimonadaceae bacterium]
MGIAAPLLLDGIYRSVRGNVPVVDNAPTNLPPPDRAPTAAPTAPPGESAPAPAEPAEGPVVGESEPRGEAATPTLPRRPSVLSETADDANAGREGYPGARHPANIAAVAVLGLMLGLVVARVMVWGRDRSGEWWGEMDTADKVTLFLGVFAGIFASVPFLLLLNTFQLGVFFPVAVVAMLIGFSAVAVYALRSMDEILPWYKGRSRRKRQIKILDTNVLIDGRIYDVARAGFLEGLLYVPGFVLDELQHIADHHDALRRARGRRGLDVLRHLQADFPTEIRTHDKLAPDLGDGVDARLVRLARALGSDILTNDFNLNRVATMQNVRVLNINDLALALRPNVLPGETMTLTLIREGNQPGQGVGYLDDGTMVVVEGGRPYLGETIDVTVSQVIQTERGKMIFAEAPNGNGPASDPTRRRPTTRRNN